MRLAFDSPGLRDALMGLPGRTPAGVEWVTPDGPHDAILTGRAAVAREQLREGRPVLYAPGDDPGEAEMLGALEEASRRLVMPIFPWRFLPALREIDRSRSRLGAPGLLRVHRWQAADGGATSDRMVRETLPDVDVGHWFFAETPDRVHALRQPLEDGACLVVHLGYPSGGMALFHHARARFLAHGYESVTLIGSEGAAYRDEMHDAHLLLQGGGATVVVERPADMAGHALLESFVESVSRRRPFAVTLEDYLLATRVTRAISRSLAEGEAIGL